MATGISELCIAFLMNQTLIERNYIVAEVLFKNSRIILDTTLHTFQYYSLIVSCQVLFEYITGTTYSLIQSLKDVQLAYLFRF